MFPQEYLNRCYECITHFDKFPLFFCLFFLSSFLLLGRLSSIFFSISLNVLFKQFASVYVHLTTLTHFTLIRRYKCFFFLLSLSNFLISLKILNHFIVGIFGFFFPLKTMDFGERETIPIRFHYLIVFNGR